MGVETVINKQLQTVASIGRARLHALLPDEFEYYSCTLELMNSKGEIEGSLVFPIMPNNMSYVNTPAVNVKKTAGGVISLTNNLFTPSTISLQGTFGRRFRLIFQESSDLFSKGISLNKLKKKTAIPGFDDGFKNGYGTFKLLENICAESIKLDEDRKPKFLFFYNQSLNQNHLVEVTNFTGNMSLESNMIWNYSLEFKTIAIAENVKLGSRKDDEKKLTTLLSISILNRAIFSSLEGISPFIKKTTNKIVSAASNKIVSAAKNKIKAGR